MDFGAPTLVHAIKTKKEMKMHQLSVQVGQRLEDKY